MIWVKGISENSIFERIFTFAGTLSTVLKSILKLQGEILPDTLKTKLLYWRQCWCAVKELLTHSLETVSWPSVFLIA